MKLISSTEITRNRIFSVTMDHAVDPGGFEIQRAIVQHRGSAVMMPVDEKVLLERTHKVKVPKKFPATLNSEEWPPLIEKTLAKLALKPKDVDAYVFTQIRKPTIVEVMEKFNIPMEKTHTIMEKWGYTGSACVPMAFHDMAAQGKVKRGDRVLLCASGGGYSMACMTFRY